MADDINEDFDAYKAAGSDSVRRRLRAAKADDQLINQHGKDSIKVRVPPVKNPRFIFDQQQSKGVGSGSGQPGDEVGQPQPGQGQPGQGGADGESQLDQAEFEEFEYSSSEIAELMFDEWGLPRLEPKGKKSIERELRDYSSEAKFGPEGLRKNKRSLLNALKRVSASGDYVPGTPVVWRQEDKRYHSPRYKPKPNADAVIIYMLDVSGSMGETHRLWAKTQAFWINLLLRSAYPNIDERYIIHDTQAEEVERDEFFKIRGRGGTNVANCYGYCAELMEKEYPFAENNVYAFHFSDGDRWSIDDASASAQILYKHILPNCNQFGYSQITPGNHKGDLRDELLKFRKFLQEKNHKTLADRLVIAEEMRKEKQMSSVIRRYFEGGR